MIKRLKPPLAAALAATLAATHAPADPPGMDATRVALFAMHAEYMAVIREVGMKQPANLAERFEAGPKLEWDARVAAEFVAPQLSDFFTGAQVLAGPYDETGGVFGLYNPWWDALLMLQTKGALPVGADDRTDMPKITRFALLSGESFRREKVAKISCATVVPGEDPLSTALWRVQAATVKRFNEIYSDAENVAFREAQLGAQDRAVEMERIQARSALRLKGAVMLMKNKGDTAVSRRAATVLREATAAMMKKHFASPPHAFFVDTFAKLPAPLRNGMESYGYVPTAQGSLFLFVNKDMPRVYATVSFPAGRAQDKEKGDVIMEWYDLDQAAELLAAWESEKTKGGAQ
ncbi:MAG: hypothetical protein FWF96_01075 [Kiritimatiellaeota bacterium]|nr:hypothetical protein [Kiritimatiellota bacterium]